MTASLSYRSVLRGFLDDASGDQLAEETHIVGAFPRRVRVGRDYGRPAQHHHAPAPSRRLLVRVDFECQHIAVGRGAQLGAGTGSELDHAVVVDVMNGKDEGQTAARNPDPPERVALQ